MTLIIHRNEVESAFDGSDIELYILKDLLPGTNPASNTPRKNRHTTSPA